MNMDDRLLALGVPPDILDQIDGGDEIEVKEDPPGCCFIGFLGDRSNDPFLSFPDLQVVLPSIGHRFSSLLVDSFEYTELNEAIALQLGTIIHNNLPNITSVRINGFVHDEPRKILVQHLPQQLKSLTLAHSHFQDVPSALTHIPDSLKGLKSLTIEDLQDDRESDTTPIFQSLAKAIQELPNLEYLGIMQIQSTNSERWNLVCNAILEHANIRLAEFVYLVSFPSDGSESTDFQLEEATENRIIRHLGINRVKAMLGRPSKTTNISDDHFRKWVVAMAAFRHQPACLQYLLSPEAMDPAKFAQAALDAINQQNPETKIDGFKRKIAHSQARVATLEDALRANGLQVPPLEDGQEFLLQLPEQKRQRLERERVFFKDYD
ncbi:expressed unknown protein [Seminavis robusta]|uniref:Uncharacterized protein n=1 Tax=Seminavis robusta TaxID=568900 RepID=A0A9N8DQZ1_9STRA|nr:expressed unknown protein [Seminavis robusta]|eukprot:Sro219_g090250.1 n/a (379) ;mRNA; r:1419-2555